MCEQIWGHRVNINVPPQSETGQIGRPRSGSSQEIVDVEPDLLNNNNTDFNLDHDNDNTWNNDNIWDTDDYGNTDNTDTIHNTDNIGNENNIGPSQSQSSSSQELNCGVAKKFAQAGTMLGNIGNKRRKTAKDHLEELMYIRERNEKERLEQQERQLSMQQQQIKIEKQRVQDERDFRKEQFEYQKNKDTQQHELHMEQ